MSSITTEVLKMFSVEQKRTIAEAVEKAILAFDHPEMPKEKPVFKLHIEGEESWSWADIEPNWVYDDKKPGVNPWNEAVAENMDFLPVKNAPGDNNNTFYEGPRPE